MISEIGVIGEIRTAHTETNSSMSTTCMYIIRMYIRTYIPL